MVSVRVAPVRVSVIVTVAFASGLPASSVTVPSMPEVICCAAAGAGMMTAADRLSALAARRYLSFMGETPV